MLDAFRVFGVLVLYVMRRVGTLSFEEKVQLLRLIGLIATNPHASYRVTALDSGHIIETPDQRLCILPNSSPLSLSDTESKAHSPGCQSSDSAPTGLPRPPGDRTFGTNPK